MDLYLLRHGDAADRLTGGYARDEDRPLTAAGRAEARDAARALAQLGELPGLVLTSPLVRAVQTATIAAEALRPAQDPAICAALAPGGSREAVVAALLASGPPASALLVGHMPDLGELAGWLVWGQPDTPLAFRTGGLCRITVPDPPAPGTGDLRWLLPPKLLRRLGAG
jgi:phosphohistidine phosphatase